MARTPDAELARLKAEVSVQRLAEGCGAQLRKQGSDLVGACPFDGHRPTICLLGCHGCPSVNSQVTPLMVTPLTLKRSKRVTPLTRG